MKDPVAFSTDFGVWEIGEKFIVSVETKHALSLQVKL